MTDNTKPQPAPKHKKGALAVWATVIHDMEGVHEWREGLRAAIVADMRARDEFGRAKYGTPLQARNGRDHLADAYQEALDGAAYLKAWALEGNDSAPYVRALETVIELRTLLFERDGR